MSNYCSKMGIGCELANSNGYCSVSACVRSAAWNNVHSSNVIYNLTTAPKRDDGIYIQLFAVKDGVRYDMKEINLKDASAILTNSLMDGIEKLCEVNNEHI